VFYKEVKLKD
jgi:hypothetical protein